MLKEIMQKTGDKARDAIINIPESVKKNLPRDFNIGDIGKIDLKEAETIANEDFFLIRENELIEGLEDFDLIPLNEKEKSPSTDADVSIVDNILTRVSALEKKGMDSGIAKYVEAAEAEQTIHEEQIPVIEKTVPEVIETRKSEVEYDDGRKWVSLEELENYDEHGQRWVPLEELISEDIKIERAGTAKQDESTTRGTGRGVAVDKESFAGKREDIMQPHEMPSMVEGYVENDDEYVIWDVPVKSKPQDKKESVSVARKDKKPASDEVPALAATEEKKSSQPVKEKEGITKEEEVVISLEDLEVTPKTRQRVTAGLSPIEYKDTLQQAGKKDDSIKRPERLTEERTPLHYMDLIPAGISGVSPDTGHVFFIDDKADGSEQEEKSIFNESELDKIISGIVQVDEGSAYILREANVDEDRERIAVITEEFGLSHEDLFVDLDYKYSDDELDYIHTAIVEEDYSSYIREIDEFFLIPGGRTIPAAVELLGLTADEFDTIEDMLYQDEFKDIHLFDRYHLYEFDRSAREGLARDRKNCRYLLPDENSLMDFERDSIESDVSSGSALIFEEDIQDITEQLIRRTGKTDAEIHELVERTLSAGAMRESHPDESKKLSGEEKADQASAAEKTAAVDGIFDITDRVVILDDEADVDRFVKEFPVRKQTNIKMLLKYLDGLFETLPEEIIKKFASSEYFELYLKVLNELGV